MTVNLNSSQPAVKSCPFCGQQPNFSDAEWIDDRRYLQMSLGCCATMKTEISYTEARGMSDIESTSKLQAMLADCWNTRAAPDAEPAPTVANTTMPAWTPQKTGVGSLCAPGPADKQVPLFLLRFDDAERGDAISLEEKPAREGFAKAEGRGWNCYLFELMPRAGRQFTAQTTAQIEVARQALKQIHAGRYCFQTSNRLSDTQMADIAGAAIASIAQTHEG